METEKRPWWTEDQAALAAIPPTPDSLEGTKEFGRGLGSGVSEGVPQLKTVDLSSVIAEYGVKDELLNYHFYDPTRYAIRMEAEGQLEKTRQEIQDPRMRAERQQAIARAANRALEMSPWPSSFEKVIYESYQKVFPYTEFKVSFFPEVDSWSLVSPIPSKGVVTLERMEEVIHLVDAALVKIQSEG